MVLAIFTPKTQMMASNERKLKTMNIPHLGQAIRQEMKRQNYPVRKLAAQLGLARSSVYYLLKKRHFNTGLLWKISLALNHNFFTLFEPTYAASDPLEQARGDNEQLRQQLAEAREQLASTRQALHDAHDAQHESQRHREVANALKLSLKAMAGMKK